MNKYSWVIPTLSYNDKHLLSAGYVKCHFNRYITNDIIQLISLFHTRDDVVTLNDIKNAKINESFTTSIAVIQSLKWYLIIRPNVSYTCTDTIRPNFTIECCLIDIPSQISLVSILCTLTFKEINSSQSNTIYLTNKYGNKCVFEYNKTLFDFKNLKTFTFEMEIAINGTAINVATHMPMDLSNYLKKNNSITIPYKLPLVDYNWNIKDIQIIKSAYKKEKCAQFVSRVFKIWKSKWALRLCLKNDYLHLYLCLLSLAPEISHICVGFKFAIKANGIKIPKNVLEMITVSDFNIQTKSTDWGNKNILKIDEISNFNNMVIEVDMVILNIYRKDNERMIVTDYFQKYINTFAIEIPEIKCKWCITDLHLLNQTKSCNDEQTFKTFKSSIFKINVASTKWQLKMYPNRGYVDLFLNLVSLSKNISKIAIRFRLCINNIKSKPTTCDFSLDLGDVVGYGCIRMCTTEELKDLNRIEIELHMTVLDVFDKNGNVITDYCNQKDLCIDLFSEPVEEYSIYHKISTKSWDEYVNNTKKQTTQIHNNRTVKSQFKKEYKVTEQEAEADALVNGYGNKKKNKKRKQKKKRKKKKQIIVFDYNLAS